MRASGSESTTAKGAGPRRPAGVRRIPDSCHPCNVPGGRHGSSTTRLATGMMCGPCRAGTAPGRTGRRAGRPRPARSPNPPRGRRARRVSARERNGAPKAPRVSVSPAAGGCGCTPLGLAPTKQQATDGLGDGTRHKADLGRGAIDLQRGCAPEPPDSFDYGLEDSARARAPSRRGALCHSASEPSSPGRATDTAVRVVMTHCPSSRRRRRSR